MPPEVEHIEEWLDSETKRLLATVDMFRDRDLTESSSLADWSARPFVDPYRPQCRRVVQSLALGQHRNRDTDVQLDGATE